MAMAKLLFSGRRLSCCASPRLAATPVAALPVNSQIPAIVLGAVSNRLDALKPKNLSALVIHPDPFHRYLPV